MPLHWFNQQPQIGPERIGIVGSGHGGSIAIIAAAEDDRIKVCVAGCPLGKGDSTLRMLCDTEEKLAQFMKTVEEKGQKSELMPRFDIVFIPENLCIALTPDTPMELSTDIVNGFLSLNPLETVSHIKPRPLMIIHAEDDHVVPVHDSRALGARAGENCDLDIIPIGDHFIFNAQEVTEKIGNWLVHHLPAEKIGSEQLRV